MKIVTREQWLREGVKRLAPILAEHGAKMPELWHVSFGFPLHTGNKAIGQAFPAQHDRSHMFISPVLEDCPRILDVLLHEMIHLAVGLEHKHGGEFKRVARAVGLEGKLTATVVAPDSLLGKRIRAIAEELGPLDHKSLVPIRRRAAGGGWVRLVSPENPHYKLVISPKMLEDYGYPLDPEGNTMVEVERA